jgi:hypothetical protein
MGQNAARRASRFPSSALLRHTMIVLPTKLSRRGFSRSVAARSMAAALALAATSWARTVRRQTLFVIARSTNANVVHYEAQLDTTGRLEEEHPLLAYWVMHAEDGHREDLSWFERQFAYGWSLVSRAEPYRVELRLTAFPQRGVVVRVDAGGSARAELQIAGRVAVLRRIFVQLADGGGPTVRYIDLFGTDLASGKPLRERLEP